MINEKEAIIFGLNVHDGIDTILFQKGNNKSSPGWLVEIRATDDGSRGEVFEGVYESAKEALTAAQGFIDEKTERSVFLFIDRDKLEKDMSHNAGGVLSGFYDHLHNSQKSAVKLINTLFIGLERGDKGWPDKKECWQAKVVLDESCKKESNKLSFTGTFEDSREAVRAVEKFIDGQTGRTIDVFVDRDVMEDNIKAEIVYNGLSCGLKEGAAASKCNMQPDDGYRYVKVH